MLSLKGLGSKLPPDYQKPSSGNKTNITNHSFIILVGSLLNYGHFEGPFSYYFFLIIRMPYYIGDLKGDPQV